MKVVAGMVLAVVGVGPVASRPTGVSSAVFRRRVRELERRQAEALRRLIPLAETAGDTASRLWAYRRLWRLGVAREEEGLALAVLCLKTGFPAEAEAVLRRLLRERPADLRCLYLLALAAERTGRCGERDRLLRVIERLHLADGRVHLEAGDFLAEAGFLDYAQREWQRVLALEALPPGEEQVEAHLRLAGLLRRRGRFLAAARQYRSALGLIERARLTLPRATIDYITVQLALALREAGRVEEARRYRPVVEDFFRRRLERDPRDTAALNALGWYYAGIGEEVDRAIALLERALALEPGRPEFLDTLAELHYLKGDPARALELIRKALAARPKDPDYYRGQEAKFLRALKQWEQTRRGVSP